jgi:hypothetical protein
MAKMDTTNHVERHWELIKYTLLKGKVNHALRDLIIALVGSAKDRSRASQSTLINDFKMIQRINKYTCLICSFTFFSKTFLFRMVLIP